MHPHGRVQSGGQSNADLTKGNSFRFAKAGGERGVTAPFNALGVQKVVESLDYHSRMIRRYNGPVESSRFCYGR